jgi:hypothetical protein
MNMPSGNNTLCSGPLATNTTCCYCYITRDDEEYDTKAIREKYWSCAVARNNSLLPLNLHVSIPKASESRGLRDDSEMLTILSTKSKAFVEIFETSTFLNRKMFTATGNHPIMPCRIQSFIDICNIGPIQKTCPPKEVDIGFTNRY